mmetsp:Transcript_16290/g.15616  ORF Transcript_16290/g.15616 Transcript_16290/m.15616 type:complete len:175 (+) Transcript_16290:61-585(+)
MPQDSHIGSGYIPNVSTPSMQERTAHSFNTFNVTDVLNNQVVFNVFVKGFIILSCDLMVAIGAFILVSGVIIATVNVLLITINGILGTKFYILPPFVNECTLISSFTRIRIQFAQMTYLGLEVLIIGDVLATIVKGLDEYSFESLAKLGVSASFKVVLAYILSTQIKDKDDDMK